MACVLPITCIRPQPELASQIATGPHSTLSREEIAAKIRRNPLSYSRIVHPRELLGEDPKVYEKASDMLWGWVRDHTMLEDDVPAFYLYRLAAGGHQQTGLVCRTPIDDLIGGKIHAHETIRESKLLDLAHHIEACRVQIGGPILMACRSDASLTEWMRRKESEQPMYDFVSENGVSNQIWRIDDEKEIRWIRDVMEKSGDLYIADGHHRVMASVEICRRRRAENPNYTGEEPWNYLACVCFAEQELQILSYARAVKDRNGLSAEALCGKLAESFDLSPAEEGDLPRARGEFLMYTDRRWTRLKLKPGKRPLTAPELLDVSVLQELVLEPILGIGDPRSDRRLDFVGGTEQLQGLLRHCRRSESVGFLLYPTSIGEVFAVADAEATMPPKSTWFEPKLCNGLFLYRL